MSEEAILCPICGGSAFRHLFQKDGYDHEICNTCRLIRIHPQPSDEELEEIYNNAERPYYEQWGKEEEVYSRMKRLTFERFFSLLPSAEKQGLRFLDIGAATGIMMQVAEAKGYEVYGIEASRAGAEAISRKFGPDRIFNGYFNEDFSHWNGLGFDVVCLCDLLEHVRQPSLVLAKIHSMLNEGGSLIILLPDASSFSGRVLGWRWPHYMSQHLWSFSRKNIGILLHNHSFALGRIKAAPKYLNLEYVRNFFRAHGHFEGLVKMLSLLMACLPRSLSRWSVPIYIGQMLVTARKTNQAQ